MMRRIALAYAMAMLVLAEVLADVSLFLMRHAQGVMEPYEHLHHD